jgi:hypothetical protein
LRLAQLWAGRRRDGIRPAFRRGKAPVMQGDGRIDQVDCGLSK